MTTDNFADNPAPDTARGSEGSDSGQTALVILIVVAVLASVVMLFTDSNNALKIALLAALWAAIVGFFLVYRYRAQAREAVNRIELSEKLHAAQLEQARAASLPAPVADDTLSSQILVELREEIAGLRAQLEELSGQRFGYEPEAIRAEAKRIMEVEARAATQRAAEEKAAEQLASPESAQEERAKQQVIPETLDGRPPGAPSMEAVAGRVGRQDFRQSATNPLSALITENSRREAEVKPEPKPEPRPQTAPRGGRRRRDENHGGVTVAELMKNLNKDDR